MIPLLIVSLVLAAVVFVLWRRQAWLARDQFIRNTPFPPGLLDRYARRRPELSLKDRVLVARALRQFFLACNHSGGRFVSMPSQAAGEFTLLAKAYEAYCRKALGRMLDHAPAVALGNNRRSNEGLRRAWWHACKEENLDPRDPPRLPLLFAIDGKFGIAGGYRYTTERRKQQRGSDGGETYYAGDFCSTEFDGCTAGFGDSGASGSWDSGGWDGGGGDGGGGDGGGGDGGGGGD